MYPLTYAEFGMAFMDLPWFTMEAPDIRQKCYEWAENTATKNASVPWMPCDVSVDGDVTNRMIKPSVRRGSKIHLDMAWLQSSKELPWKLVCKVLKKANVDINAVAPLRDHFQEALKYEVGDFFRRHTDSKRADNHIGVVLLVIPAPHLSGGDLVIYESKTPRNITESCQNVPHLIFLPLDLEHCVLPVTEGSRIVFKCYIQLKDTNKPAMSRSRYRHSGARRGD